MYLIRSSNRVMLISHLWSQFLLVPRFSSASSSVAAPVIFPSQNTPRSYNPTRNSSLPSVVRWQQQIARSLGPSLSSSASSRGFASMADVNVTYLTQREAAEIDELLMGPLGFSVDQLMV